MSVAVTIGIDGRSLAGSPTGVGRYVGNLVRAMGAIDPDVRLRLYTPAGSSALAGPGAPEAAPGFETRVLGSFLARNVFTWNHIRLPLHLIAHPVDLFHGTFYTLPAFCPVPSVVTIHDITFHLHPEWYTRKARIAFNGFAAASARKARHIITVSECSRRDIINAYGVPAWKVTAVPLAPDPGFKPAGDPDRLARMRKKYSLGEQYVLHVGAITPRRNLGRLLEAFAMVRRRAPHLMMMLAGSVEPPSPPIQIQIERMGLGGSVRASGYVSAEDLPDLYGAASAVVYPSLYEGFGLPVIEAMACGVPVLASATSCFPEVAGDAALLIDPESTEAIAEGLWSILSDVALRELLISRGLARAAGFTWERTARGTLEVYRRALSAGAQPAAGETA